MSSTSGRHVLLLPEDIQDGAPLLVLHIRGSRILAGSNFISLIMEVDKASRGFSLKSKPQAREELWKYGVCEVDASTAIAVKL